MASKFRTPLIRLAFVTAMVMILGSKSQAQAPLRWKFEAGQVYRYEFVQRNKIKVKTEGQEFTSNNDLTVNLSWKVKSVTPEGTAEIVMLMERVQAIVESGPQMINYDSKGENQGEGASKPFHDVYSVAIGPEYKIKMDARGQVLESKVPEKVTAALQVSPFVGVADGGSFLSDKGVQNVFAQVVPVFPEKAVSKGDTWNGSIELPVAPLKLTLKHTDTLTEIDGSTAKVSTVLETSIKPDPDSPLAIEMKSQEGKGTVTIDTKAGRITASTIVQTIEMGIKIMNKQIDQTVSINADLKLLP